MEVSVRRPGVSANISPLPEMTISEVLRWTDQVEVGQKAIFEVSEQGKVKPRSSACMLCRCRVSVLNERVRLLVGSLVSPE